MTKTIKRYIEEFEKVKEATHEEPVWLRSMRQEAVESFARKGFPTVKDEAWRYTDLAEIVKSRFSVKPEMAPVSAEEITRWKQGRDGYFLFFINGLYRPEISDAPVGIRIRSISDAIAMNPELRQFYKTLFSSGDKVFMDINLALGVGGVFIEIPGAVGGDCPIYLIYRSKASGLFCQPKNIVKVGKAASAVVIEDYGGAAKAKYFTNAFSGVILEEGAVLKHSKIQQESEAAFHVGNLNVRQGKGSSFSSLSVSLGSKLMRQEISVKLAEEAVCRLSGICLGRKNQHFDHVTRIDHAEPAAKSGQLFKGILGGEARSVFTGRVLVRQGAQKTEAQQTNKNLLLSPGAQVDSRPQLEIHADDVKCSHGAAVGQLEDDAIFYLRSRGMSVQTAQRILAEGFAREITNAITDPQCKTYVEKLVSEKLAHLGTGGQ